MVNISKHKLSDDAHRELLEEWVEVFSYTRTKSQMNALMKELLSPAERVQCAKRLALIAMLERDVPFHEIQRSLHVSSSTVSLWIERYEKGKFAQTRKIIGFRRYDRTIAGMLEKLLGPGLEMMGKKRKPPYRV